MSEFEPLAAIAELIELGEIIPNGDGTFKLSEGFQRFLKKLINEKPEIYTQIFPERLN